MIMTAKHGFSDYNIYLSIDPEKKYDFSQKNIFIVTHDRVIDESTVALFELIDFLVIDEVYKLQKDTTNERVLILNIAYYNMVKRSKKYVLLAPFISGVENLEKLDDVPAFYGTNFSPVVNDVKVYNILNEYERNIYTDKILRAIPSQDNTLIYFPTVVAIDKFIKQSKIQNNSLELDSNPILNDFISWANVLGKLSDSRYLKLSRQYEKEQAEIEQLAAVLEREIEAQAGQVSDVNEFLKLVDKYLDIPELDATILNELVSRIVVHSPVRENGRKQVRIDLYFTYVGQIRIPLKIGRESLNESEPA